MPIPNTARPPERADRTALAQLLEPASIAIIGASRDTSRIGGVALDHLQRLGYQGQVYPVNPRYAEIAGLACYADVESLPAVPDVRIMCFHPDPNTTQGEAQFIGDLGRALGWTSVILVTTPDQAWRAKLRVERCFDGEVFVATTPLPPCLWVKYVPYQWGASARALLVQRSC